MARVSLVLDRNFWNHMSKLHKEKLFEIIIVYK